MAKFKENKGKSEKHIKGSNKNILGKKISKARKTSIGAGAAKLSKFKPKTETADRYKKKFPADASQQKKYGKRDESEKGASRKKNDSIDQGKFKKEGENFSKSKPFSSSSKGRGSFTKDGDRPERKSSTKDRKPGMGYKGENFSGPKASPDQSRGKRTFTKTDEKREKKSSFKDFRSKGDKIKKTAPADRRTFLSTDEKRKLSEKSTSKNSISNEDKKTARPFREKEEKPVRVFIKKDFPENSTEKMEAKPSSEKSDEIAGKKNKGKNLKESTITLSSETSEKKTVKEDDGKIRLNRYISNAGVCSRRDADKMIEEGLIKVNGEVITELGYKVRPEDSVKFGNKVLNREKNVYILLNKPKDFITTLDDPEERKTVMDLVKNACSERVYPVGRLDRNTTGLLLLTNDGALAATLTHPSYEVKKIYQVDLDKPLEQEDLDKIINGLELEDGPVFVDDIEIVSEDRKIIGLEIHVGRNRIVRRMFEHLGYDVVQLDRVMYAGLTKKDLSRGKWRLLTAKEIIRLKHFKKE